MPTKFSITRFNADSTPQPDGLRCISVFVPDDDKFVVLLASVVGLLTRATNWEGEQSNRDVLAQLCLNGYIETEWTGCMDCGDVQDCIETDEGVQGALTEQIINNIENNSGVGQSIINYITENNTTGTPMPDGTASGSMVPDGTFETDDACDEDKVGTGCEYLSRYIDGMVSDFFELLASQTENAKIAAKAAGAIPVLGDYIQSAAEFAIALQEKIAVTYSGAQSEENILSIACDFKCKADLTCSLSIDDAIDVIVTRLGTISPSEFGEIITLLITGTFEGVQIVETGYLVALAALKFGQAFGPNVGIRPIGQIMQIGAADENNGWETWCPDCPDVCVAPSFIAPTTDYDCGSVIVTDNLDGTWTAVFTSAFSSGAHRCLQFDENQCCWNTLSVVYSVTPENLSNWYNCGANPPPEDVGADSTVGNVPVGECSAGLLAASVSTAFTITIVYEVC